MQASAALIREKYLAKPVGKSNVAVAELYLDGNVAFCAGATSKRGIFITLTWSSSIDKKSSLLYNVPNSLKGTLSRVWQQHYEELYEPEAEGTTSLQDALDDILSSFQSNNPTLSHLRYVWMALILASVVEPTVKYYQPHNFIPEETINRVAIWLIETLAELFDYKMQFAKAAREEEINTVMDTFRLFTESKEIASFQVLSEDLDVYSSAIKALDSTQSLDALLDILDDCLEGYAIFPGSYGRRELFDWWLLDVVPASWYLVAPSSIYSINKLAHEKYITSRLIDKLEKISEAMWSVILAVYEHKNKTTMPAFRNTFDSFLNKSKADIKIRDNQFILDRIELIL